MQEYRLNDAELFFGRSTAIHELIQHLGQGPLTVLHAESGAGKSSLLQAGVAPQLIGNGHLPIYLRPYNVEPALAIKRAFLSDPSLTPMLATGPLRDFLRQVTSVLGPQTRLYIFIDQFEEFFTQLDAPARTEFMREYAECVEDSGLNVRWLFSLRAEFFGHLANCRPYIRNPYENEHRLNAFTREEALEVITAPAARRQVHYEPGLTETILNDLGTNNLPPMQLQLICSALYEGLAPGTTVLTRALYDREGGALGILRSHLDRVLTRGMTAEHRAIAQRALEALITADGHRVMRTRDDLLAELNTAQHHLIAAEVLGEILEHLVEANLLRSAEAQVEDQTYAAAAGLAYELAHDYLLEEIKVDPGVQARKAAQELLEQEIRAYAQYGSLLNADKLAIIKAQQANLTLTDAAKNLLRLSEQKLRRQQRVFVGSIGLAVVGILTAIIAFGLAFNARTQQQTAVITQQAAQTQAGAAQVQQSAANVQADAARAREATSVALATQAGVGQATAVAAEATAITRADEANAVVQGLFDSNGLVPAGAGPRELAFDGRWLWVSNSLNDTIQKIDPATGVVQQTLDVGYRPGPLVFDKKYLWVLNQGDNTLQAVDVDRGVVVKEILTADRPSALLFDGQYLWVSSYRLNQVQAFNPETGQEVGAPVPTGPFPWVLGFDGHKIWVANRSNDSLSVFDTRVPTDVVTFPAGGTPAGLAFDGNWMWVSLQNRHWVNAFNPATREKVYTITAGLRPSALNFNPASGQLWVANQGDSTVQVIDRLSGDASAPVSVGELPRAIAFAGELVWVANFSDNTVEAIDPVVGSAAASIKVGLIPRGLVFDNVRGRLWVTLGGENKIVDVDPQTGKLGEPLAVDVGPRDIAFDGQLLWVVSFVSDTVQAINPETRSISYTVKVGRQPRSILYALGKIWVANDLSDTVQAIDPTTGAIVETVQVGHNPFDLASDGQNIWVVNNGENTVQAIIPGLGHGGVPIPNNGSGAIAFGGGYIWVNNFADGAVQIITPTTGQISPPIQMGGFPAELTFAGGQLWVVNFGDNTVQAIDPLTRQTSQPVQVCVGPTALTSDGKNLWVSCRDSNNIQAVSLEE